MPYGLEIRDSSGNTVLNVSTKTIRLANYTPVVTSSTSPVVVQVSSQATPSNSIAVTENGNAAAVTSVGTVTIEPGYFRDPNNYNTKLRVFLL